MRYLILILIISFLSFSCKKDKLEGDKSIFIGNWNWVKSDHKSGICTGDPPIEEIITPDSEGFNYTMEFLEKGVLKYFENGTKIEKDRIIFSQFNGDKCNTYSNYLRFAIYLDNDQENFSKKMDGCVSQDTLVLIRGFPYYDDEQGCESYVNYFVRQ